MDGLDNSFGLTMATGSSGSERAWADLVRISQVPVSQAADLSVVASQLTQTAGTSAPAFSNMLEALSGTNDALAARVSDLIVRVGPAGLRPLLQQLEVLDRKRAVQSAALSLTAPALAVLAEATGQAFSLPMSQPLLELIRKLAPSGNASA